IMYAAADGSLYYGDSDDQSQALKRYDPKTKETTTINDRLPPGEFGAIAPSPDGRDVYFLMAESKEVYRLDLKWGKVQFIKKLCGVNRWRLYNLHLSLDGDNAYYVSNNNDHSKLYRLHIKSGLCREELDIDELLGPRNLCFGGVGIWDDQGSFYAPVWTLREGEPEKLAILKATVEDPMPFPESGE
ncbi:MAG: hypothetical protein AAF085_16690, partial [Planctomycetota bacterium]